MKDIGIAILALLILAQVLYGIYVLYQAFKPKFSHLDKKNALVLLEGLKQGLHSQNIEGISQEVELQYVESAPSYEYILLFCLHAVSNYKDIDKQLAKLHYAKASGFFSRNRYEFTQEDKDDDTSFERRQFEAFLTVVGNTHWYEKGKLLGQYQTPFYFIKLGQALLPKWRKLWHWVLARWSAALK